MTTKERIYRRTLIAYNEKLLALDEAKFALGTAQELMNMALDDWHDEKEMQKEGDE